MENLKNKKIVVAMSGGIDSSVAAALLKQANFDVVGVFMKFWKEPKSQGLIGSFRRCCSPEAETRARKVASILKIPFYVFDFQKEFKKRIVDYFLKEYKTGRTPNPCVICNKQIKFGLLLEKALKMDADFIATGHYARLCQEILNPKSKTKNYSYKLLKAKDKSKDQSYFLWMLKQNQLKRILFPLGNYTKKQVRELAKKFKLPVLNVPESMEICFVQGPLNDFLKRYLKSKPGKIVCLLSGAKQKVVGQHQGLWFYTLGQRKGIKLSGGPYYVLDKNQKKNLLLVTKNENDLCQKELTAKNINWISAKKPKLPLKIKAKIRYRHQPASATIIKSQKAKTYTLKFDKPQRAITPGQSVVFFKGKELLGGGIIN